MTATDDSGTEPTAAPTGALAFEDVTLRMFPLRASSARLKLFCDRYLNVAPQIARFRPAGPFVFMMAINYGRMLDEALSSNWIAQREFMFTIPLEWYDVCRDGSTVFRDWACVSPFIFVDDPLSIKAGREVYGWPKVLGRMKPDVNAWMRDPRANRRLLCLETLLPSNRHHAGESMSNRVLLEVDQVASQAAVQVPVQAADIFGQLARMLMTMMQSYASAWEASLRAARLWTCSSAVRQRISSVSPLDLFQQCIGAKDLSAVTNTINLKQFRGSRPDNGNTSVTDPGLACYQSLVNAKMNFEAFKGGGLLGAVEAFRGDLSGGFQVRIHRHAAYPIVESLGLATQAKSGEPNTDIDILRPVAPFWMSFDFRYDYGERICWRSDVQPKKWWTGETADGRFGAPLCAATPAHSKPVPIATQPPIVYNTSLGPSTSPMSGPFDFYDTNLRVLPLLARYPEFSGTAGFGHADMGLLLEVMNYTVMAQIDAAIAQSKTSVKPKKNREVLAMDAEIYPSFVDPTSGEKRTVVFMICTSRKRMSSKANDVGWWAKQSISFAYLVRANFKDESGKVKFSRYWLAPVIGFANSPLAVTTGREVTGLDMHFADIRSGVNPWLENRGAHANDQEIRRRGASVRAALLQRAGCLR